MPSEPRIPLASGGGKGDWPRKENGEKKKKLIKTDLYKLKKESLGGKC